jgi:hypothetical protein
MATPIGFILTITGLTLAVWVWQMISMPGPAPLETFPVGAFAVAMISVGIRYVLKGTKQDKLKRDKKKAEKAAKKAAKEAAQQGPTP